LDLTFAPKLVELGKIRVGIVNYLNTKPLLYGLQNDSIADEISIVGDYPSRIADLLINKQIDVGLIPVAAIHDLPEWSLAADYCIGCDGAVGSVCLFSDVPLNDIQTVLLDYQSRTSVMLLRLLLREYWKISPEIKITHTDYRDQIRGTSAGLVIGDRSFEQKERSRYSFDLGTAWKEWTGLPFVFAAWISNQPLPPSFVERFNKANAFGVRNIETVAELNPHPLISSIEYFRSYISYDLDDTKKQALKLFLRKIESLSK
jgi:chorismate dehydratase